MQPWRVPPAGDLRGGAEGKCDREGHEQGEHGLGAYERRERRAVVAAQGFDDAGQSQPCYDVGSEGSWRTWLMAVTGRVGARPLQRLCGFVLVGGGAGRARGAVEDAVADGGQATRPGYEVAPVGDATRR
jgi:hypothetical protein